MLTPRRQVGRKSGFALIGVLLWADSGQSLVSAPVSARAKVITRQEITEYSYVGESGPTGFGDDVGPICGKQRPKFRHVAYSGDFVTQTFIYLGWPSHAYTVSGATEYSASTGQIISQPMVQLCSTTGRGSDVAVGSPSGTPKTLPVAINSGLFTLSNYSSVSGGVRQGDNILHEVYTPPDNGLVGFTTWTRDNVTITYSEPDTFEAAVARGAKFPGSGTTSGYSGSRVTRCFYRIQFEAGCGKFIFHFNLLRRPCGGGAAESVPTSVLADVKDGGRTAEFELPLEEGYKWEILPEVWAEPVGENCGACSSSEPGLGSGPQAGSVDWSIPLGNALNGDSFGVFLLRAEHVSAALGSPEALKFFADKGAAELITAPATSQRQVRTPLILADLTAPTAGNYQLSFYRDDQIGAKDMAGFYTVTGAPYLTWSIAYTEVGGTKTLAITRQYQGASVTHTFAEESTSGGHVLTVALAGGLRTVVKTTTVDPMDSQLETVRTVVKNAVGEVATETEEIFRVHPWARLRVSEARDPDGANLVTTWTYNEEEEGEYRGYLQSETTPDGLVRNYSFGVGLTIDTYTTTGSWVASSVSGRTSFYMGEGLPPDERWGECTVTATHSTRSYRLKMGSPVDIGGVSYREEAIQDPFYYGEDEIAEDSYYSGPNGFDAPGNRITQERYFADGPFKDRIAWRLENEERLTTWSYAVDPVTGVETTVSMSGSPDTEKTTVVTGTREESRRDRTGVTIWSETTDIVTSHVAAREEVLDRDAAGRPTLIAYLDGTTDVRSYSPCCGLLESTTRNGHTISYGYDLLGRKIREEANGIVTHFDLDAEGRVKRERREGIDETEIIVRTREYDKAGRLRTEWDALNRPTTYETELLGDGIRRETTTNPDGATLSEVFNADGTLDSRSGEAAVPHASWSYDLEETPDGFVTAITEHRSETQWVKTFYDMQGLRLKVVYPDDAEETFAYDVFGRPLRQVDADGVTTLWTYEHGDLGGGMTGERTTQAVDLGEDGTAGNGVIDLGGTDRITRTTAFVTTHVDGAQNVPVRRMKTEIWLTNGSDVPREASVTDVSLDGLTTWQTVNGLTTKSGTVYDSVTATRTETTSYPDQTALIRIYQHERLESETRVDAAAQTVASLAFDYDEHGRLETETDSLGRVTSRTYYDDDQVHTVTSPDPDTSRSGEGYDPQTTTYVYDNAGRMWKVEQPDGAITETTYWGNGKVKRVSGGRVYPQAYTYDDQGRVETLTTWQDYAGETGAAITTWHYHEERGWLEFKDYNGVDAQFYTYTPAGRLESRAMVRTDDDDYPLTTYYGYNQAGELINIDYSDLTPPVAHTYDRLGRPHTTTDAAGLLTRSYDPVSLRLEGETYTGTGLLSGRSITRGYDSNHRPQNLTTDTGYAVGYGYDNAGRLGTITEGFHGARYGYKAGVGTIETVTVKRSGVERVKHDRTTDALNRVSRVKTIAGANSVVQRDYTYNDANQRTRIEHEDTRRWAYGYDALGQVTTAQKRLADDTTPLPGYSFGYMFDTIGNRTGATINGRSATYTPDVDLFNQYATRTVPGAVDVRGEAHTDAEVLVNEQETTRTGKEFYREIALDNSASPAKAAIMIDAVKLGPPDQLVTETLAAFLPQTPESFTHDDDGSLQEDGRWTYTWDAENRLVAMETLEAVVLAHPELKQRLEFVYDAQGRRIAKTVKAWNLTTSTWQTTTDLRFVYDGWNLLAELDALSSDAVLRTHVWGSDVSGTMQGAGGVGGLLWSNTDGHTFAASADANGNVVAYINTATTVIAGRADYGAFGEPIMRTGIATTLPFGFSTKYTDSETGLLYYGYRYLVPNTGRWLSRDPIEEQGGLNLYGMVNSDAINNWDYLGLSCKCGPDITLALRNTLKEVGRTWRALSPERKDEVASNFVSGGGWDIDGLKVGDYTKAAGERAPANAEDCQQSVTIEGRCYYKGSVNYILYGRMFRLAGKWRIWRRLSIGVYKGIPGVFSGRSPNIYPSQQWAMLGNHNWTPTPAPILAPPPTEPVFQEAWDDYDPDADNLYIPVEDRPKCTPSTVKVTGVLWGHVHNMYWGTRGSNAQ